MADFTSICDQLLSNEDINVKGWREGHQMLVFITELVFPILSKEFEVLITGF